MHKFSFYFYEKIVLLSEPEKIILLLYLFSLPRVIPGHICYEDNICFGIQDFASSGLNLVNADPQITGFKKYNFFRIIFSLDDLSRKRGS